MPYLQQLVPLGFKKPSTDGSKWKELALNGNSLASDNHCVLVPLFKKIET